MSVLTEMLGSTVPHEFEHDGVKYKVSLITQELKAKYEKAFFQRARELAASMRDMMDKADYQDRLERLQNDYMAGKYAFMSKEGIAYLETAPGVCLIISLIFGCDETQAQKLMVEREQEVTALISLITKESFPKTVTQEAEEPKK